jgi:hypothetical protein
VKIISKQDTIIHYSIDPYYFNTHSEIKSNYSSRNCWQHVEGGTHLLTCGISFLALDYDSRNEFINYQSEFSLHCLVEDIEKDISDIIKMKEDAHILAVEFIKSNSMAFFDTLKFPKDIFTEERVKSEKRSFYVMIDGKLPVDQQDETSREIEDFLKKNPRMNSTVKIK